MITKEEYEEALDRIEELLPNVNSTEDADYKELEMITDMVISYEKENYPISFNNN